MNTGPVTAATPAPERDTSGTPDGRTYSGPADAATPGQAAYEAEIPVRLVQLWLCDLCLDGDGDECHTPGCSLWIHDVPKPGLRGSQGVTILGPALEPFMTREDFAAQEPHALAAPWRQGRSQPRNVYARTGGDDWKADQLIGHFDTDGLAAAACRAHNAEREPHAADGLVTAKQERQPSREVNLLTDDEREPDCLAAHCPPSASVDCEWPKCSPTEQPAPDLAARPGEALAADNATLRDVITEVLGWFGDNTSGRYARVSGTVLARAYAKSPGIAVPEELRRYL